MDRHVLATLSRDNEPIPLRIVEPLHGSSCHTTPPPPRKRTGTGSVCSHPVLAQLRSHRSTADQLALGLAPSPGQKTGRTCDRRRTHEHPGYRCYAPPTHERVPDASTRFLCPFPK